jgi:hypothetical protein
MISFFVVGFALSLAHCIFYPKLKGKVVGNSSSQEEKLRWVVCLRTISSLGNSAKATIC